VHVEARGGRGRRGEQAEKRDHRDRRKHVEIFHRVQFLGKGALVVAGDIRRAALAHRTLGCSSAKSRRSGKERTGAGTLSEPHASSRERR